MKKISKMNEAAWALGIVLCSLGVALCTKADFGLSMIAAPSYILQIRLSEIFPWYSRGVSEYMWQGLLLILLCIVMRGFQFRYLLSFFAAMVFGYTLDGWLFILGGGAAFSALWMRVCVLILGELITAFAIAFYFRTDMPIQIYDLLVKEISKSRGIEISRVKRVNDLVMLILSVLLALLLNHSFQGVGIGTVLITLLNAPLIAAVGRLIDRVFSFEPRFPQLIVMLK